MLERRTFIRNLALVSAAVALRPTGLDAAATSLFRSPAPTDAASLLTGRNFTRLSGQTFTVSGPGVSAQSCVLTRVMHTTSDARLENFSLHFEGRAADALAEGTYRFSHDDLGSVDLFVVARPIDARAHGYEAVINRLV